MKDAALGWKICVVTQFEQQQADLANALLYADDVIWIPTVYPLLLAGQADSEFAREQVMQEAIWREELVSHQRTIAEVKASGPPKIRD